MPTTIIKTIGNSGCDFTSLVAFGTWLRSEDLVANDQFVRAKVMDDQSGLKVRGAEVYPLTRDATRYVIVEPGDGLDYASVSPTGAVDYPAAGVELTLGMDEGFVFGVGVVVQGFRIHFPEEANFYHPNRYGMLMYNAGGTGKSKCQFQRNIVKIGYGTSTVDSGDRYAIFTGSAATTVDVNDNVFIHTIGIGAAVCHNWNGTVARNTFVRRGASAGTHSLILGGDGTTVVTDNVFVQCGAAPVKIHTRPATFSNNYTDTAVSGNSAGYVVNTTPGALLESLASDLRPKSGGALIGTASIAARNTADLRNNNRGMSPDAGAVQRAAAPPATGVLTFQPAVDGQSQRFVGTTTHAVSGMYTLTGTSGGVTVGPTLFTVAGDAFDFTVVGLTPGTYTPTLTVINSSGNSAVVSGTSVFSIAGATGGGEVSVNAGGETPVAHYALIMENGRLRRILDAELGTGKKPVVVFMGRFKVRAASEGTPVVLSNGRLTPLPDTDELKI